MCPILSMTELSRQVLSMIRSVFYYYSEYCDLTCILVFFNLFFELQCRLTTEFVIPFKAKPGCPVVPKGFEENQPEPVKQVIEKIQQQCSRGRNRSLLVASRSWLSCITKAEN